MSRFGTDPHAFFDTVYLDVPPWDIGGAQPAMASLLAELPPEAPALDLGCGSGGLAISLAPVPAIAACIQRVRVPTA